MALPLRRLTLAEFLELPEEKPALEYDDGVITRKMSPKGPRGRLEYGLGFLIGGYAEPRQLAAVFIEARVSFAGDSFVPDLILYRWDRIPRSPDGRVE